jgi:hypothetical protein
MSKRNLFNELLIAKRNNLLLHLGNQEPIVGYRLFQDNDFQKCLDMLDPEFPVHAHSVDDAIKYHTEGLSIIRETIAERLDELKLEARLASL